MCTAKMYGLKRAMISISYRNCDISNDRPLIYPNLSNTLEKILILRISIIKFRTIKKTVARRIILWF